MDPLGRKEGPGGAPPLSDQVSDEPALLRALLTVFRHLKLEDQVRELGEHAVSWTGVAGFLAFVRGDNARHLQLISGVADAPGPDEETPKVKASRIRSDLGERGEAVYQGLPPFLPQEVKLEGGEPGTCWALAIRGETKAIAAILVLMGDSAPDEESRARVRQLVEAARPAIANGITVQTTRVLIYKDDTADCFNRRYFDEFLVEEMARAIRFRSALSLIFFDMDNLKDVNSRHGHAMGSRTLYEVSLRVRPKIRRFDKLFRFGGDEFCIVLPETEWHGALEVAERVRESIAGKPLLVLQTGGEGVKMTASFGIASFPLHARTGEDLIQRADWAMQRIKRGTKNSIAVAEIAKPDES